MYESHLFARCTAHHAVLYWDKPAAARAQQTYTVYLNNQQTATTDRTHYTLGGLEPQTEYRVDVLCGDQPVGACMLRTGAEKNRCCAPALKRTASMSPKPLTGPRATARPGIPPPCSGPLTPAVPVMPSICRQVFT